MNGKQLKDLRQKEKGRRRRERARVQAVEGIRRRKEREEREAVVEEVLSRPSVAALVDERQDLPDYYSECQGDFEEARDRAQQISDRCDRLDAEITAIINAALRQRGMAESPSWSHMWEY